MNTIQDMTFDTISKRSLYGLRFIYSEFKPIESDSVSEQSQKQLHELMGLLVEKLYENPALLKLPDNKDEAYQTWEVNNMKPELDKVYQTVFKTLFEFYKFLYMLALHGRIDTDCLTADSAELKVNKTAFKPLYKTLLNEVGVEVSNDKTSVSICADEGVLQGLKLLAEKVPVNINKWTPFVLSNFACCSFTNDFSYLIQRADQVNALDGLLFVLQKEAIAKGYTQLIKCEMTATYIGITILFKKGVGGFQIGYNPRKYKPFQFGTMNGIGEKAMLEDFDNLDEDLKEHFVNICRPCSDCRNCMKGGKNEVFTVKVSYNGKDHALCPCFPNHSWDTIDKRLINLLFKYHDAQNIYGVDWKK